MTPPKRPSSPRSGPALLHRSSGRRTVLRGAALTLAAAVTGCRADAPDIAAPPVATTTSPASPSYRPALPPPEPPSAPPALPPVPRWRPDPAETLPDLKQAAADLVQDLCTRGRGDGLEAALARTTAPLDASLDRAGLLALAAPLGEGVTSTGRVVYPQFGGLDPNSTTARTASVMVVVVQRRLSASGAVSEQSRTVDVRLRRGESGWAVTSVPSVGGEPVARSSLPDRFVHLLDSPLVSLPDSARWDLHAQTVSDDLVDLLVRATELGPLSVTCLRNGHPFEVFATDRPSDHSAGKAADLWRVGGVPVVRAGARGTVAALQQRALADPRVSQVGSPPGSDRDGPRSRRSFANLVHEDHLHLSVRLRPAVR